MKTQGVKAASAPFIRSHLIDMEALMDVEPGVLPADRYASLIYTGNGIKGNRALPD